MTYHRVFHTLSTSSRAWAALVVHTANTLMTTAVKETTEQDSREVDRCRA